MKIESTALIVVTEKLVESRDFYANHLGGKVNFENDWFINIQIPSVPFQISLMKPDLDNQHVRHRSAFAGDGILIRIEVDDVDAYYARLNETDIEMLEDIRDEPWGERHFNFLDPNGVTVDISMVTEPSEEYASHYK